ncbi:phenylacetate--CoA ligase family protein [Micromonospora sp. HM5-17]|uniref:phenylacetate--CoA ligase family protein n=1 Tax=Micromonospora sp. HM5-17 TaxID=2487710 RepID=UPI000F4869AF|nr:phenylacetate--CoA ligase family protein [Micromonospora sp. HM5-17]ROT33468.1 phenylacetate--CoA ligase family protein [Micromonospora sp. HM5-17]
MSSLLGLLWDARRARRGGPDAITRRQRDRLAAIVDHARTNSRFYRRLYRDLPDQVTDPAVLPVVDKKTLMAQFDDWICAPDLTLADIRRFVDDPTRVGQHLHGRYTVTTTSGTTGTHGIFIQDHHTMAITAAMAARMFGSWLTTRTIAKILTGGRRMALIAPTGGHFATATAAARLSAGRRGKTTRVFSVHDPIPQLVDGLNQFRPAILLPYATVGAMLASEAQAGRLHIDPALVVLSAEGLPPSECDRIAAAFGATVGHTYAANEVPFLSYSCRYHWLHVNADWVTVEPVDADHQPVPPGEPSHTVLVTNLANRIQPILRYNLGDSILMRPDPCECGNPLPAIRVQGRAADLLTFTTSAGQPVTIAPLALATLVERIPGVELFQIQQATPTTLRVRLLPATGADPDNLWHRVHDDITNLLASHSLGHVDVERANEPPQQTTGGKYRQIIPLTQPR